MKTLLMAVAAAVLAGACALTHAFADETAAQPEPAATEESAEADHEAEQVRQDAKHFIGNVSLALMAVDYGRVETAANDIGYAEQNLDAIGRKAATAPNAEKAMRAGRLAYSVYTTKNMRLKEDRYALLPFDGEVFSVPFGVQPKK